MVNLRVAVVRELEALYLHAGIRVSDAAIEHARYGDLGDFDNMSAGEIADLLRELHP